MRAALCCSAAFGFAYLLYTVRGADWAQLSYSASALFLFTSLIEIGASFYAFTFLFVAVAYLRLREPGEAPRVSPSDRVPPPVGIIYLCCGDLDGDALRSLLSLRHRGELHLIVHDDSRSDALRQEVDAQVARLGREVTVLRRHDKTGGKPGAVNYVLQQTGHLYDFFVLCDNDSTALDPELIEKALPYFEEAGTAIVQCRTVPVPAKDESRLNGLLSRSIEAFHVYMSVWGRYGWRVFIGHNAILRTRAVLEVGGLTPGFFADDLDLTLRLNFSGHSVAYAPHLRFGEKHPATYTALRKRTHKWAYGCMQLLKAHTARVLATRSLTAAEKISFFQFAGFYLSQTVLLTYLVAAFVLAPFCFGTPRSSRAAAAAAGALVLLSIFSPVLAYFVKAKRWREALVCTPLFGLIYGTGDFSCARGVWMALRGRPQEWAPTNGRGSERSDGVFVAEFIFGLLLLAGPLLLAPALLLVPTSCLFAGKFLFTPAMAVAYDRRAKARTQPPRRAWRFGTAAIVAGLALVPTQCRSTGLTPRASDSAPLTIGGQADALKGVHYGPWRAGTGPADPDDALPPREAISSDLALIKRLNANTIAVVNAPEEVLDLAQEHGLRVLYTFYIDWKVLGSPEAGAMREGILSRARALREKPALLAWILGSEIPQAALERRGEREVVADLAELYRSLKAVDPRHPVSHSNWPPTRTLDLGFLDFASFNLYPLWPPEVPAAGYGNYIRSVLKPLAGARPLVITEFGVNTIEAGPEGQARLLAESWKGIGEAGIAGGVVFEFADEWWKNYDNPVRPGNWWDRRLAADDPQRHDQDPEEHYGLVTETREPKPAFAVVRGMFAEDPGPERPFRTVAAIMVGLLATLAVVAYVWARLARGPSGRPGARRVNGSFRRPAERRDAHLTAAASGGRWPATTGQKFVQ
jgi:cellulose synthase/poly-beta-1,6-N-acetylglucosamine synthase-like glycosyltransferase